MSEYQSVQWVLKKLDEQNLSVETYMKRIPGVRDKPKFRQFIDNGTFDDVVSLARLLFPLKLIAEERQEFWKLARLDFPEHIDEGLSDPNRATTKRTFLFGHFLNSSYMTFGDLQKASGIGATNTVVPLFKGIRGDRIGKKTLCKLICALPVTDEGFEFFSTLDGEGVIPDMDAREMELYSALFVGGASRTLFSR